MDNGYWAYGLMIGGGIGVLVIIVCFILLFLYMRKNTFPRSPKIKESSIASQFESGAESKLNDMQSEQPEVATAKGTTVVGATTKQNKSKLLTVDTEKNEKNGKQGKAPRHLLSLMNFKMPPKDKTEVDKGGSRVCFGRKNKSGGFLRKIQSKQPTQASAWNHLPSGSAVTQQGTTMQTQRDKTETDKGCSQVPFGRKNKPGGFLRKMQSKQATQASAWSDLASGSVVTQQGTRMQIQGDKTDVDKSGSRVPFGRKNKPGGFLRKMQSKQATQASAWSDLNSGSAVTQQGTTVQIQGWTDLPCDTRGSKMTKVSKKANPKQTRASAWSDLVTGDGVTQQGTTMQIEGWTDLPTDPRKQGKAKKNINPKNAKFRR